MDPIAVNLIHPKLKEEFNPMDSTHALIVTIASVPLTCIFIFLIFIIFKLG